MVHVLKIIESNVKTKNFANPVFFDHNKSIKNNNDILIKI